MLHCTVCYGNIIFEYYTIHSNFILMLHYIRLLFALTFQRTHKNTFALAHTQLYLNYNVLFLSGLAALLATVSHFNLCGLDRLMAGDHIWHWCIPVGNTSHMATLQAPELELPLHKIDMICCGARSIRQPLAAIATILMSHDARSFPPIGIPTLVKHCGEPEVSPKPCGFAELHVSDWRQ